MREGFLVLKKVVDPESVIYPVCEAFARLVDQLLQYVLGKRHADVAQTLDRMDFPGRFAALVELTGGSVFHHIGPSLNIYERSYRRWRGAPSAQLPEFFELMTAPKLLDAIELLIGKEIWATPGYQMNLKLAASHRQQAREFSRRADCKVPRRLRLPYQATPFMAAFQTGRTPWHVDGYPGLGELAGSSYINVWLPLTPARPENSTLVVLPRSHLEGYGEFPSHRQNEAVTISADPGDVVLMDGRLFHSSTENRSEESFRWAFNMRYLPRGNLCGRPFLPGFAARSQRHPDSVLSDSELWQQYWAAALDYMDRYHPPVPHPFRLSVAQIERLERRWQRCLPNQDSWLQLHRHGNSLKAAWSALAWAIDRQRGRISALRKIRRNSQ